MWHIKNALTVFGLNRRLSLAILRLKNEITVLWNKNGPQSCGLLFSLRFRI